MMRLGYFLMVAVTVLMLAAANCLWQNMHCGTPIIRTNPLQVAPCEPVDKIAAEIKDLNERATHNAKR